MSKKVTVIMMNASGLFEQIKRSIIAMIAKQIITQVN